MTGRETYWPLHLTTTSHQTHQNLFTYILFSWSTKVSFPVLCGATPSSECSFRAQHTFCASLKSGRNLFQLQSQAADSFIQIDECKNRENLDWHQYWLNIVCNKPPSISFLSEPSEESKTIDIVGAPCIQMRECWCGFINQNSLWQKMQIAFTRRGFSNEIKSLQTPTLACLSEQGKSVHYENQGSGHLQWAQ